jgi:predicted phosphodiesterase
VLLGVLSDVHGNPTALDAVLADGRAVGVDSWWVLGDLVAIGPEPAATLDRLTSVPRLVATRGNTERYVLTGDRPPPHAADVAADPGLLPLFAAVEGSFAWTRGALAATGWPAWLADLSLEVRRTLPDGTRLLGVHASPSRDDGEGVTPQRPEPSLAAALACADPPADVVLTGHTHQPTDRRVGAVRAVNGGSVSNPITDDLRAGYVVVAGDRHGHRVVHRRVEYDHDLVVRRLAESGHPQADWIASFQRGGQVRHAAVRPGAPEPVPGGQGLRPT